MATETGGRPLTLDADMVARVATLFEEHIVVRGVSEQLGISLPTLQRWLAAGRKARRKRDAGEALDERERLYVSLVDARNAGIGVIRGEGIKALRKHFSRSPQAVIYLLGVIDFEAFGDQRHELKLLKQELKELRQLIEARNGTPAR